MEEAWKDVVGYEGLYEVSDMGRVRTVKTGLIRKPKLDRYGYVRINLNKKGIKRTLSVHVLVLEAFIGLRPDGTESAHWDGDPLNNRVTNLRWATPKENSADKVRHGTNSGPRVNKKSRCFRGHLLEEPNLAERYKSSENAYSPKVK